ncbi:beta-galactosidase [Prosthecobacter sp.]|uniref:beta-galactosidase n=1 Tax=Prosthecobacter sp. TaxID=1965333 RepID=UPI002ABC5F2F|nr:beta-galactosidase [Prosthecobacter sp.]MDZ4402812.1 beta-galactosidase [Prosthecobacter sp.]
MKSLFLLLLASFTAFAADFKATSTGIEITAGSLGSFTLTYPEFEPPHKIIEVKPVAASAMLRYEGGTECVVSVAKDEVGVSFRGVTADVKSWKMSVLIDIGFAKGGSWKIAEKEGAFPAEKATPPHIASLNGTSFMLKNAQGQSLSVTTPDYAFQQLTDNRTWDWAIYHWMFIVPYAADRADAKIKITTDLASVRKLIDPFGQSIKDAFPNKLKSLEDLKADVKADKTYYAGIETPKLDRFGGLPGSGESQGLKKTGFFHVEQKQDKWWLVDPDGNAFFHFGLCGFAPSDDYTYVKGREGIYEWLPKAEGEFASAFRPGDGDAHFSFYLANVIRKFGAAYDYESHATRMIERVRKWGFNSIGAFSPVPETAHVKADFPYVAHLPINEWEGVPRIPGAHEVWDPYDAATEKMIAAKLAAGLPARANDPLLIGYFIVNEPRYDELPRVIPSLPGKHACKQRLVAFLKERYKTADAFNAAWQAKAASFDDLVEPGLAVITDTAKADVKAFVGEFMETYFAQIEKAFRQHDTNHMLIGSRLQPITIKDELLCRIMGKHLDVVSYNYYTFDVDTAALKRYHEWTGGKPMMLSEFFWSSPRDSGLIGGRALSSQQERGLAYRNYVEQSAALGFVVGIEWFTLIDQATTGRWFSKYNGESYNTGLISVADRPWKDMLAEMMKTNHTIYDLLLGKRPPFKWDGSLLIVPSAK